MIEIYCPVCCRAFGPDSNFFSPENDNKGIAVGPAVPLAPINMLKLSRCDICTILAAGLNTNFLRQSVLDQQYAFLKRAIIDPYRAVAVYVGADDVSHTTFSRIPASWCHLPLAQLNKPHDDKSIMKEWITDCVENHPECKNTPQSFVPTRLLDISVFENSDDIQLVTPDKIDLPVQYVALSHSWGPPSRHPITTTSSTLESRMSKIPFEHLSRTFQDAVTLTRQLGQRYLWIDSLCIIQDDKLDWGREAAAMATVYGNSFFTIFALSSENSDGGCRVNAHNKSPEKAALHCDVDTGAGRIRLFESKPQQWHVEYGDDTYKHGEYGSHNALRTRAWTLQERELSTRGIHFSAKMVLWECRTAQRSSELPWDSLIPIDDNLPQPMRDSADESLEAGGSVLLRDKWYGLVEDFSSRFLSHESDKLPALSGLALKYAGSLDEDLYLAGIWRNHMPSSLLWKTVREFKSSLYSAFQPRRPMTYRAPSWSWASVDCFVSYDSQRLSFYGEDQGMATYDYGNCQIVGSELVPASDNIFGAINAGSLQMRGCIRPLIFCYQPPDGPDFDRMRKVIGEDGSTVGAFFPDIITEVREMERIHCLTIKGETTWAKDQIPFELYQKNFSTEEDMSGEDSMVMGLALKMESGRPDTYTRVGLIRWMKKSMFFGIEPTLFTLL